MSVQITNEEQKTLFLTNLLFESKKKNDNLKEKLENEQEHQRLIERNFGALYHEKLQLQQRLEDELKQKNMAGDIIIGFKNQLEDSNKDTAIANNKIGRLEEAYCRLEKQFKQKLKENKNLKKKIINLQKTVKSVTQLLIDMSEQPIFQNN